MELNQFTDYSLRALLLAALKGDELTSVKEIASTFDVSENHLVKVVHRLSKLGFLQTFRGRGGGVTLARPAEEIGLGEVVRAVEPMSLVDCMPPKAGGCRIAGVCELQFALTRAKGAFLSELDKVTLADLVKNRKQLQSRLNLG